MGDRCFDLNAEKDEEQAKKIEELIISTSTKAKILSGIIEDKQDRENVPITKDDFMLLAKNLSSYDEKHEENRCTMSSKPQAQGIRALSSKKEKREESEKQLADIKLTIDNTQYPFYGKVLLYKSDGTDYFFHRWRITKNLMIKMK